MELVHVSDSRYKEYETLLLQRDQLQKEAAAWEIAYMREFGDLITSLYEASIACIRLKKQIAYCQTRLNRGCAIDAAAMEAYLDQVMKSYNEQLEAMARENETAKAAKLCTEAEVLAVKRLYRTLAKQIHPDINPKTADMPELRELWQRIILAYRANALNELEELAVLVRKALDQQDETIVIDIPDLADKISKLRDEIAAITSTDPYQYQWLLKDKQLVGEKKDELTKERQEFMAYKSSLEAVLRELLTAKEGTVLWRVN